MTPNTLKVLLDDEDFSRARSLKYRIFERLNDTKRHFDALRAATEKFGDTFDIDEFREAFESDNPDELNQVKAVERGVDQLYNYIAELTSFGLELACIRRPDDDLNAGRDIQRLRQIGVISSALEKDLQEMRKIRRTMVHEYTGATADQVHLLARMVLKRFPDFIKVYVSWTKAGFDPGDS